MACVLCTRNRSTRRSLDDLVEVAWIGVAVGFVVLAETGTAKANAHYDAARSNPDAPSAPAVEALEGWESPSISVGERAEYVMGSTVFGFALGTGVARALSYDRYSISIIPIAIAGAFYAAGTSILIGNGSLDRGDLPMASAILWSIPVTIHLLGTYGAGKRRNLARGVTLSALAATPLALFAAEKFTPDPGDTQLVRDSGLWGLLLSLSVCMAFGPKKTIQDENGYYTKEPPGRKTMSTTALMGLYGGLALGGIAATHFDVTMTRVRLATWGGYGGIVLGALARFVAMGFWYPITITFTQSATIGGILGLATTFVLTRGRDHANRSAHVVVGKPLRPSIVSGFGAKGRRVFGPGLEFAWGT